jgi:hypothetical protein
MNLDRHTTRRSLSVGPKLRAIDGVESLTMKKQINGFILGMLLGGAIIFTIAADNRHPATWDYKVMDEELKYNQHDYYSEALNQAATNGWEIVSSQIVPKSSDVMSSTESVRLYIVLRHPKQ